MKSGVARGLSGPLSGDDLPARCPHDFSSTLCRERLALISRDRNKQTERLLLEVWNTTFARLQQAVAEHIELGRKVYKKIGNVGGAVGLEANVTLFEGLEIYVEMKIRGGYWVILAAHGHYTRPLP